MTNYKLIYFNVRGRAELSRLILHCAEVPFEDFRIEHSDWPSIKQGLYPKNQFFYISDPIPILEVDNGTQVLAQSNTIARYLARRHGLAGKDDWEESQADMFIDCIYDLHAGMRPVAREKNPEKEQEVFDKVNEEMIQPHAKKIEQFLIRNGTGFLVGNAVTWADIAYYAYFTTPIMERLGGRVLDDHPHLKKLVDHIGNIPSIKKYIETRPTTSR